MRRRPRSRTCRVDPGYRPRRTRARPRDKLKKWLLKGGKMGV